MTQANILVLLFITILCLTALTGVSKMPLNLHFIFIYNSNSNNLNLLQMIVPTSLLLYWK